MIKDLNPRTVLTFGLIFAFLTNAFGPIYPIALVQAQEFRLPAPGVLVHLSPPLNPPILKGIKVHPDNPFRFDFILDKGESELNNEQLTRESSKLIKYFLASLTIPEKDLWVNLSPYEKDRIIPNSFGLTSMGRDLLAEDYMLKQITASLIYPEDEIGKRFWKLIYANAAKRYGTTDIPVNTFNKVWIVPEKAVVYENTKEGTAYVVESKLKVMLDQDFLSFKKHEGIEYNQAQISNTSLALNILQAVVIPELTKEVNENKNFAQLRQVYNSLILATWYKKKIKESILSQVYADKNKVVGVNIKDPQETEKIYQRYLKAFKKGVFNYIKEDMVLDPAGTNRQQGKLPRKYFSGGAFLGLSENTDLGITPNFKVTSDKSIVASQGTIPPDRAMLIIEDTVSAAEATHNNPGFSKDSAMTVEVLKNIRSKGYKLTKVEIEKLIPSIFEEAIMNKGAVIELFREHSYYFLDPVNLRNFLERFARYKNNILKYELATPGIIPTSTSEFARHIVFLMLARGTIKDLVWRFAQDSRKSFESIGGKPAFLYNIFDPTEVQTTYKEAVERGFVMEDIFNNELEWKTGHKAKDFRENPELYQIFADQFAVSLQNALRHRQVKLPRGHKEIDEIKDFLVKRFKANKLGDDRQFYLTGRNINSLKGGGRAGDCTAPGSMNYWTEGMWNAAWDNQELETYYNDKFFSRLVTAVGQSDNQPTLWVHAIEFTPLARDDFKGPANVFSSKQLQQNLLLDSFKFLAAFARRAGIKRIYVTEVSNSPGFVELLKNLLEGLSQNGLEISISKRPFRLFNGFNSAHYIRAQVLRTKLDKTHGEKSYLQGWGGSTQFSFTDEQTAQKEFVAQEEKIGGQVVPFSDLERVAPVLMTLVRNEAIQARTAVNNLSESDSEEKGFKGFMYELTKEKDYKKAVTERMSLIRKYILNLTQLYDPGAADVMDQDLKKVDKMLHQRQKEVEGQRGNVEILVDDMLEDLYEELKSIQANPFKGQNLEEAPNLDENIFGVEPELEFDLNGDVITLDIQREEEGLGLDEYDEDDRQDVIIDKQTEVIQSWQSRISKVFSAMIMQKNRSVPTDIKVSFDETKLYPVIRKAEPAEELLKNEGVRAYIKKYKESLVDSFMANGASSLLIESQRLFLRPNEVERIYARVSKLISNIDALETKESEAILNVINGINPDFMEKYREELGKMDGIAPGIKELMIKHPQEVIDFYKRRSEANSKNAAKASLISNISTFTLDGLMSDPLNGYLPKAEDSAMNVLSERNGGIDLTSSGMNVEIQNNGKEIKFHLDPVMLQQLQSSPGFIPVIIHIQPLKNLSAFLGLNHSS